MSDSILDYFEARHAMALLDDRVQYCRKPVDDPISRLGVPQSGITCGVAAPLFAFTRIDLAGLITSFADGCDTVVELGSGYGRQLFDVWLAGGPVVNQATREGLIEPLFVGRDLFGGQSEIFTQGSVIVAAKA